MKIIDIDVKYILFLVRKLLYPGDIRCRCYRCSSIINTFNIKTCTRCT